MWAFSMQGKPLEINRDGFASTGKNENSRRAGAVAFHTSILSIPATSPDGQAGKKRLSG
jgi:hypothetical protein